ncbi:MAG: hypothetical protein GY798_06685 [Hyphomicrobiales bacterium]|nr:hypothetical protein [Hyphomicrobiales bacterium]
MITSEEPQTPSEYQRFSFTYRFDGADWSIEVPALSLEEARERVRVLGFARYDGDQEKRRKPTPNGYGSSTWFRSVMRSAFSGQNA